MEANQSIKGLLSREFLHDKETHALICLLASEQAAVQTYELAIRKIRDKELIPILENCRDSHAVRIKILQRRLQIHGDKIPESAGWLGTVAGIVENGATIFGDRVAMSALAAGEELELEQCQDVMKDLDNETYKIVQEGFLPAQKKTLQTMTILCAWLKQEEHDEQIARDNAHLVSPAAGPDLRNASSAEPTSRVRRHNYKNRKRFYNPWYFG